MARIKSNAEIKREEENKETHNSELTAPEETVDEIIGYLRRIWRLAYESKRPIEDQLLKNYRQIKGIYEPDKLAAIKALNAPETFIYITATKFRNADAWAKEILFQPGTVPFDIEATPIPELPEEINSRAKEIVMDELDSLSQQMIDSGIPPEQVMTNIIEAIPDMEELAQNYIYELSKERVDKAKELIKDKLVEGGWFEALRMVIPDVIAGTGFIKGPIPQRKKVASPDINDSGNVKITIKDKIVDHYEWKSPFHIFPAPFSSGIDDGYLFDLDKISPIALQKLIGIPSYESDNIKDILKRYEEESLNKNWALDIIQDDAEEQARAINEEAAEQRYAVNSYDSDKIDILEFWGAISGNLLLDWKMKIVPRGSEERIDLFGVSEETDGAIPTDEPSQHVDNIKIERDKYYDVTIWWIEDTIIRATINPSPLGHKPYSKASFIEKNGAFWGEGLPELISDSQGVCNACARAIVHNVGVASGPQVERNLSRIPREEYGNDIIVPWKVWDVVDDTMMGTGRALNFYSPDFVADKIINVFNTFSKMADEQSGVPGYAHGDSQVGGAGRTASGLSMLMSGAARGIRSLVGNIDNHITIPVVEKQYYRCLSKIENLNIIADLHIVGKGTSSLIAKEQQSVRRLELLNNTNNPLDFQIMGLEGRRELLIEALRGMDIDIYNKFPELPQQQQQGAPGGPPSEAPNGGPVPMGQQGNPPPAPAETGVAGEPMQGADERLF